MSGKFDVVVIGTGSAASTVAYECRKQAGKLRLLIQDLSEVLALCVVATQRKY